MQSVQRADINSDHPHDFCPTDTTSWGEKEAYRQTLVTGASGQIMRRLPDARNARHNLDIVFETVKKKMSCCDHLLFFIYGGLRPEQEAIKNIRGIAPYLEANGICPVFVLPSQELLTNLHRTGTDNLDVFQSEFMRLKTQGVAPEAIKSFIEKRDRTFELQVRNFPGQALWAQIHHNAATAATGAGTIRQISHEIKALSKEYKNLSIHIMAHSCGAIWAGHMLDDIGQTGLGNKADIPIKTTTLWAPACSLKFSNRYFGSALTRNIMAPDGFHVEILDDKRERQDCVGNQALYSKSLLYLISRALETQHKTPLLGMEWAWATDSEIKNCNIFSPLAIADVRMWRRNCKAKEVRLPVPITKAHFSNGHHKFPVGHVTFINDIALNNELITRITGEFPKLPITHLI